MKSKIKLTGVAILVMLSFAAFKIYNSFNQNRKGDDLVPVPTEGSSPQERRIALRPKSVLQTSTDHQGVDGNTQISEAYSSSNTHKSVEENQQNADEIAADKFLKSQEYAEMSPGEVNALLKKMTLGEDDNFENTRKKFVTTIKGFLEKNPGAKSPLDFFKGSFTSQFSETTPNNGDAIYNINIQFKDGVIGLNITFDNKIFYENEYKSLNEQVGTASSSDLVPNIFLELPARPDLGYIHPLYLELLASKDGQTILGVLYNTDQFDSSSVHYVHAENLIFRQTGEK